MEKCERGAGVYAHSVAGRPQDAWQTLNAHAANVAERAVAFAHPFGSEDWARLLGEMHDVGKARRAFQSYLAHANGLGDADYDASDHSHSGAGACWAVRHFGPIGRLLAYCVAGHHAGLPDWIGGETPNGALSARLADEASVLEESAVRVQTDVLDANWPQPPKPPFRFRDAEVAFCRCRRCSKHCRWEGPCPPPSATHATRRR